MQANLTVLRTVDSFVGQGEMATVSAIARRAGFSWRRTHRILDELASCDLVFWIPQEYRPNIMSREYITTQRGHLLNQLMAIPGSDLPVFVPA